MRRVGIIGGGAWGTALAIGAREASHSVVLWAREQELVETINNRHENEMFLAGIGLDATIRATGDAAEAADADLVRALAPNRSRSCGPEARAHRRSTIPQLAVRERRALERQRRAFRAPRGGLGEDVEDVLVGREREHAGEDEARLASLRLVSGHVAVGELGRGLGALRRLAQRRLSEILLHAVAPRLARP